MTNSKREYNEFIRANLPYGITYDSARYQYVTFNGKRFVTYLEAKWYIDYLTKFGGGPEDDIRNDLFGTSEEGVWFEANDSTTLFTDVAGTTPVTTPGDAVALQLDKSQGLTLGPEAIPSTGFSDWTDSSVPDGWSKLGTHNATNFIEEATGGGLRLVSDGTFVGCVYPDTLPVGVFAVVEFNIEITTGSVGFGRNTVNLADSPFVASTSGWYKYYVFVASDANDGRDFGFKRQSGATDAIIRSYSVRELSGNHRTQATTAARPLYALHPVGGVRNKLEYTEEFDNAVWNKPNVTVTANAAVAPDEEATADKLIVNTGVSGYVADDTVLVPGVQYTLSAYGKAGEWDYLYLYISDGAIVPRAWFNLTTGTVGTQLGSPDDVAITDEGNGWYRCSVTFTATGTGVANGLRIIPTNADNTSSLGDGASGLFVWGAQLEQGSTATNYQRVGSFLDVSEEGKARRGRLWYNGTSHFMQTGTITPGTDKVQVFAGVRKLSDAASGVVCEFSASSSSNSGSFAFFTATGRGENYFWRSKGTSGGEIIADGYAAPVSNILTGLGDISGDSAILRIDGIQEAISTADQGTGNYLAYPLYFGARAGTSFFFNGYEDTSIIRFGPNLDTDTISKVESYVASKTPEETI